ncbi:MAG: hypothetical protein IKU17_07930 [Clostridia bacterium]|nr:hypothetical protein [Clostridia bacterium]
MERIPYNPEYTGTVTPESRYLAIGYDDFRASDFTLVEPLMRSYGARATYNRIAWEPDLTDVDIAQINQILSGGNELGDHTWFHCNYIFTDPMCNGQDPANCEGSQEPFPTNAQLREEWSNGKNAFGFDLDEHVSQSRDWVILHCVDWSVYDLPWKELTDEHCQQMRETFSIYKDTTGMLDKLDVLSNRYCGTTGSSRGSWSEKDGMYTGGIFTGSKTSCNHEIWERILQVTEAFYRKEYSEELRFWTWSFPGAARSPFDFEKDGKHYFDPECKWLRNYLAEFSSSMYADAGGRPKVRSWITLLREAGYTMTHDTIYPSRMDGSPRVMMNKQLIYNAGFSREDALLYSTNRTVSYNNIASDYPESYFDPDSPKSRAAQMYDGGGSFYRFIEALRRDTSNGMVAGEVIDSVESDAEENFLRGFLDYCARTGVEVVTKKEAHDICFGRVLKEGNLIYNPRLRNTAKEFMPDADTVPDYPDGYTGACRVVAEGDDLPVLCVEGQAEYLHFGIPLGAICYSANVCGCGSIEIYGIQNSSDPALENHTLPLLTKTEIREEACRELRLDFIVPDMPKTAFEQVCEGMGDKFMGIKIVYSGRLKISHPALTAD